MGGKPGATASSIRSPFEGALVRLRAIEEHDVGWLNRHFWNPNVTRFLEVVWPEPAEATREYVERARRSEDAITFLVETHAGERVGACGLEGVKGRVRAADMGIWIDEPFWSRGYGTDAVRTVCRFGFREMNLQRIELHVYDFNDRGIRAYRKAGFREEGRLRGDQFVDGHPVDVLVMGLLADELIDA